MFLFNAFRLGHRFLCLALFPFVSPYANHQTEAKAPEGATRGHKGTGEDRFSNRWDTKGSRHKEAYVRFRALRAAIVRIILSRDMQQSQIDWFWGRARKKFRRALPSFWERIKGEGSREFSSS